MKKKAAQAVIIISTVVMFAAFAFGISFYYRCLPHAPEPESGRIFPLNNHGYVLYMTHREQVQQEVSFVIFGVLFVVAAFTDYLLNPFERARFQRKRVQPWNHRWGP
jgi:hypothetical protein